MVMRFADYTRGFHTPSTGPSTRQPIAPRPFSPDMKMRQLRGQVAGVIQELLNQSQLSDTDRRILIISAAVQFLLSGRSE